MKNTLYTLALIGALLPSVAMAASVSSTGYANAEVVEPATIEQIAPLNFGTVTNQAAQIDVDYNDSRTSTGDTLVDSQDNFPATGRITIHAPSGAMFYIQFPSGVTLTNGGSGTMDAAIHPDTTSGVGETAVNIAGNLTVNDNQDSGYYEGSYPIDVTY